MPKVATSLLIVVALSAAVVSSQDAASRTPAFPATLRQIIPATTSTPPTTKAVCSTAAWS
jgi:hypothetical protein